MKSCRVQRPLALLVGAALWACGARGNAAQVLPAGTHLVIATRSLTDSCLRAAASELGRRLIGPDFAPLRQDLTRRDIAAPMNPAPTFGVDWPELAAAAQPCRFVVFSLSDKELGAALIFPADSIDAEPPACVESAHKAFAKKAERTEQSTRGNARVTTFTGLASKDPAATDARDATRAVVRTPSMIAITSSDRAAFHLVDSQDDVEAAKAVGDFEGIESPPGTLFLWVEPWNLAQALERRSEQPPANDRVAQARRVGWDRLVSLSGTLQFAAAADEPHRGELIVHAARPFERAFRLLDFRPGPRPQLPAALPPRERVESIACFRWDFAEAMRGFATLFDDASEPGPDGEGLFDDMLLGLLEDPEGPQIDMRRDLFAHLGPEVWHVTARPPRGNAAQSLFVIEVRDHAAVRKVLARYYEGDDRVTHRTEGDHDVWTVPKGNSLFVEGEGESVIAIRSLALGRDRLSLSTDDSLVNATLAAAATDREGDPSLQDAQRLAPDLPDACLWGAWNLADSLAGSYEEACALGDAPPSLAAQAWRLLLAGSTERDAESPLKTAPPFAALRPAFSWAGLTLAPHKAGYRGVMQVAPVAEPSEVAP